MLRKKNSEPAQLPEARQELLEFESPAAQPGKKGPKQFMKRNWKKITAVVCVAAVAAAVLLPKTSKKDVQASTQYVEAALERRDITNAFSGSGTISAANTYTVKSLVKGPVLTADFEVGDTIEKGTVLYTIDSSDVATSVEKAQLALEQAQRSYAAAADALCCRSLPVANHKNLPAADFPIYMVNGTCHTSHAAGKPSALKSRSRRCRAANQAFLMKQDALSDRPHIHHQPGSAAARG